MAKYTALSALLEKQALESLLKAEAEALSKLPPIDGIETKSFYNAVRIGAVAYTEAELTEAETESQAEAKKALESLESKYNELFAETLDELSSKRASGEIDSLDVRVLLTEAEAKQAEDKAAEAAEHVKLLETLASKRTEAAYAALAKLFDYAEGETVKHKGSNTVNKLGEATIKCLKTHNEMGRLLDGRFVIRGDGGETVSIGNFGGETVISSRSKCGHVAYGWNTRGGDVKAKTEATQAIIDAGNLTDRQLMGSTGASGYSEGLPAWVDAENVIELDEYMKLSAKRAAEAAKKANAEAKAKK